MLDERKGNRTFREERIPGQLTRTRSDVQYMGIKGKWKGTVEYQHQL